MQAAASLRLARRHRRGRFLPTQHISRFMVMGRRGLQTEREPDGDGIHIVHDHLIPNYLLHPRHRRKGLSSKNKFMTFTGHDGHPTKLFYNPAIVLDKIAYRLHEPADTSLYHGFPKLSKRDDRYDKGYPRVRNWFKSRILRKAVSQCSDYNVEVGRELLSWLYLTKCCVKKQHVPQFIEALKPFTFPDFQYRFKGVGMHPEGEAADSQLVTLYYHSLDIPSRDDSRIMRGIHLQGNCEGYTIKDKDDLFCNLNQTLPWKFFALEDGEEQNKEAGWSTFSHSVGTDLGLFKSSSSYGSLWKVSVPGPSQRDVMLNGISCFLEYMDNALRNSIALNCKGKNRKAYNEIVKKKVNYKDEDAIDDDLYYEVEEEDKSLKFRLQVVTRNPANLAKAWSMMSSKEQSRCLFERNVPSFFFFGSHVSSLKKQWPYTLTGNIETVTHFLEKLRKVEGVVETDRAGTWCALEVPVYWSDCVLASSVKMMGYNPLHGGLYVFQCSTHAMTELIKSFLNNANSGIKEKINSEYHLFEALPGLDMTLSIRTPTPL